MALSLAWRALDPEETHKCLAAPDISEIRLVLTALDEAKDGKLIGGNRYNKGQLMIMLDMLAHLILFARARNMLPEKVSTLVGIMLKVHEDSMSKRYTRAQSYYQMRELMVQHSVPRPPFSCGIFTVRDAQEIDEYLLRSYYRHYKMYVYAFVPRQVANLRCISVNHDHQVPPLGLPSLVTAVEESGWRTRVEEQQRETETERMQMEDALSEAYEGERLRLRLLNNPHYSDGIREQLDMIKRDVSEKAFDRLDDIEARLTEIESKVGEQSRQLDSRQSRRKRLWGWLMQRWKACHCVLQSAWTVGSQLCGGRQHVGTSSSSSSQQQQQQQLTEFASMPRRVRLVSSTSASHGGGAASEPLPVDIHMPSSSTAADPSDPYANVRIYRKDMVSDAGGRAFQLSVDVPLKKFVDLFSDFDGKRCKLCNESYMQWHSHSSVIPHSGREALMLEMVRAYCGTPEEIVKMWWHRLNTSPVFNRIPALSHDKSHIRKRRLQYLLKFLKDRDVIRDTFNVHQSAGGAGRSWEFERLEFLGDNVVKYVFNDRFNVVFPVREGGIRGRLGYAQFMIDGNDGLARAYDYLELQKLTLSDRVVSKFKSDVVETLFGELQLFLWSSEADIGTSYFPLPFTTEMFPLRALVSHVMEELAHVMFMYHIEHILAAIQRIVREHQLQFIRVDPAFRGHADMQNELASSLYAKKMASGPSKLTSVKVMPNHRFRDGSAALFHESANYDNFRRVYALGGLLPRPFARAELAATPSFLPHLQEDDTMTRRVPRDWWSHVLDSAASVTAAAANDEIVKSNISGKPSPVFSPSSQLALTPQPISRASTPMATGATPPLTVVELKDELLVAELL